MMMTATPAPGGSELRAADVVQAHHRDPDQIRKLTPGGGRDVKGTILPTMHELTTYLLRYGLAIVFGNVLLEQLGLPVPALPTLIVAGALAQQGQMGLRSLLGVALLASLLADTVWFLIGRWQGHRVLRTVCRLSLSPDSCVRGTEDLFERAGMPSLLYAKFSPGYNMIAPPLAGAMSKTVVSFLVWDALGSLLWLGSGVALGYLFHHAVSQVLQHLEALGFWAGVGLAGGGPPGVLF